MPYNADRVTARALSVKPSQMCKWLLGFVPYLLGCLVWVPAFILAFLWESMRNGYLDTRQKVAMWRAEAVQRDREGPSA